MSLPLIILEAEKSSCVQVDTAVLKMFVSRNNTNGKISLQTRYLSFNVERFTIWETDATVTIIRRQLWTKSSDCFLSGEKGSPPSWRVQLLPLNVSSFSDNRLERFIDGIILFDDSIMRCRNDDSAKRFACLTSFPTTTTTTTSSEQINGS